MLPLLIMDMPEQSGGRAPVRCGRRMRNLHYFSEDFVQMVVKMEMGACFGGLYAMSDFKASAMLSVRQRRRP